MAIPASSQLSAVDAQQISGTNYASTQTAMLIAVIHLYFTVLAEKPLSLRELVNRMYIDLLPLEQLLQDLRMPEIVSQAEDVYQLTPIMDTFEFPSHSYDLIIIAHVLRFIGEQRAKKPLQRVVKSLRPHGILLIAGVSLTADQQSPKSATTLNISMPVNTKRRENFMKRVVISGRGHD